MSRIYMAAVELYIGGMMTVGKPALTLEQTIRDKTALFYRLMCLRDYNEFAMHYGPI